MPIVIGIVIGLVLGAAAGVVAMRLWSTSRLTEAGRTRDLILAEAETGGGRAPPRGADRGT